MIRLDALSRVYLVDLALKGRSELEKVFESVHGEALAIQAVSRCDATAANMDVKPTCAINPALKVSPQDGQEACDLVEGALFVPENWGVELKTYVQDLFLGVVWPDGFFSLDAPVHLNSPVVQFKVSCVIIVDQKPFFAKDSDHMFSEVSAIASSDICDETDGSILPPLRDLLGIIGLANLDEHFKFDSEGGKGWIA